MNTNAGVRKKAADKALEACPPYERRRRRHESPIGLEGFAQRARAAYLKEKATGEHPAQIRNRFEALRKDKAPTQRGAVTRLTRSEEHTSELQSLMRISYAVFCLKKKKKKNTQHQQQQILSS